MCGLLRVLTWLLLSCRDFTVCLPSWVHWYFFSRLAGHHWHRPHITNDGLWQYSQQSSSVALESATNAIMPRANEMLREEAKYIGVPGMLVILLLWSAAMIRDDAFKNLHFCVQAIYRRAVGYALSATRKLEASPGPDLYKRFTKKSFHQFTVIQHKHDKILLVQCKYITGIPWPFSSKHDATPVFIDDVCR